MPALTDLPGVHTEQLRQAADRRRSTRGGMQGFGCPGMTASDPPAAIFSTLFLSSICSSQLLFSSAGFASFDWQIP